MEPPSPATSPPDDQRVRGPAQGQPPPAIRLIGYQGDGVWLLEPQLPFMYNSLVNGFAADFGSFVIVPLLLYKSRDAVGPRVEVSIVSIVGRPMQVWTSTKRTWGLGIRVTPVLRLLVYLALVGCGQKRAYR